MTISKEEALKRLDELDKKVDGELLVLRKGSDALEKRALEQAQEIKKLTKQVLDLSTEKAELSRKLEGYAALDKALSQIRTPGGVTLEQVRQVVKDELAGMGPVVGTVPPAGSAELPTLVVSVDRPDVVAEDTSLRGGIAILVSEGFFDRQRSAGNVRTKLNSMGLENSEKDVMSELLRFCQWRLLEAEHTDRWLFLLVEGAKERVKLR